MSSLGSRRENHGDTRKPFVPLFPLSHFGFELRFGWGSLPDSIVKIRFSLTTDWYEEWWDAIRKFHGHNRLARASILRPQWNMSDG